MTTSRDRAERFSGHESFICRYGWLPKIFRAVTASPNILRDEELAMNSLGIGRNMVKSIQFWGEAAGVISAAENSRHTCAPIGNLLFGDSGWDPHLESLESLWLIHWQLSTRANLAVWNEVFGEGKLIRFDRKSLTSALAQRGASLSRPLAPSTVEQHAGIFIQSYYQAERGTDDTSWCPLQDLGLMKATKTEDGRVQYDTDMTVAVGLSPRVFGVALLDFISSQGPGNLTTDFSTVLRGRFSPGIVFRLDEHQLRQLIDAAIAGPFRGALRFVDTADTQSVVLDPSKLAPQFTLWAQNEVLEHA